MQPKSVFVVQHVAREGEPSEDVKLIGVYSSRDAAQDAIKRLATRPGFRDYPTGFQIDDYAIDVDHWTDGFVGNP